MTKEQSRKGFLHKWQQYYSTREWPHNIITLPENWQQQQHFPSHLLELPRLPPANVPPPSSLFGAPLLLSEIPAHPQPPHLLNHSFCKESHSPGRQHSARPRKGAFVWLEQLPRTSSEVHLFPAAGLSASLRRMRRPQGLPMARLKGALPKSQN